jgi:hypothetical protein
MSGSKGSKELPAIWMRRYLLLSSFNNFKNSNILSFVSLLS